MELVAVHLRDTESQLLKEVSELLFKVSATDAQCTLHNDIARKQLVISSAFKGFVKTIIHEFEQGNCMLAELEH